MISSGLLFCLSILKILLLDFSQDSVLILGRSFIDLLLSDNKSLFIFVDLNKLEYFDLFFFSYEIII